MEALAREWKWTLKPTIAPLASASTSLDVRGVDGEDIAVGSSAAPRRRSYQNRCGSERPLPAAPPDRNRPLRQDAGIGRQVSDHPVPPAGAGASDRRSPQSFWFPGHIIPHQMRRNIVAIVAHAVKT